MPLALFFYPKYLTVPRVHTLLVGLNPAGVTLQAAFAGLLFVYMFLCVCVHEAHGSLLSQSEDTRGHYPGESGH